MYTVIIWLCIAVFGFLLYLAPVYLKGMAEGFSDYSSNMSTNMSADAPGYIVPTIEQSTANLSPIEDFLMSTPKFDDPDLAKDAEANKPKEQSTPKPSESSSSKPAAPFDEDFLPLPTPSTRKATKTPDKQAIQVADPSIDAKLREVLSQGTTFQALSKKGKPELKPEENPAEKPEENKATANTSQITKSEPAPVCPKCPPVPKCPPAPICPEPQCPDMSKYIRKDQIPCWGCDLE